MRKTKNLDLEVARCSNFHRDFITPHLADELYKSERLQTSIREVRDQYGLAAADCFRHIFKLLSRGGLNKDKVAYKSTWCINQDAAFILRTWSKTTKEKTCRQLLIDLKAADVTILEWDRTSRKFMTPADRATKLKKIREQNRAKKAVQRELLIREIEAL